MVTLLPADWSILTASSNDLEKRLSPLMARTLSPSLIALVLLWNGNEAWNGIETWNGIEAWNGGMRLVMGMSKAWNGNETWNGNEQGLEWE